MLKCSLFDSSKIILKFIVRLSNYLKIEKVNMFTLEQALDSFEELSYVEKNIMTEIIIKRTIESKRDDIANNALESLNEYYAGNYKSLSAKEAIFELQDYIKTE
jgi:hypothetical protein